MAAILMVEGYWRNSQFSIAKYYGAINVKIGNENIEYVIVNKEGKDIYECSIEAEKAGREKAIEPGEPADLVDKRYIPAYRLMGRKAFIEMIEEQEELTPELANKLADEYKQSKEKYVPEIDFVKKED